MNFNFRKEIEFQENENELQKNGIEFQVIKLNFRMMNLYSRYLTKQALVFYDYFDEVAKGRSSERGRWKGLFPISVGQGQGRHHCRGEFHGPLVHHLGHLSQLGVHRVKSKTTT